jgi:MFS family permease
MAGLLVGGLIWGIMGDKLGRLSVLFGSILLYSLANIANGFVTSVDQYAWLRFHCWYRAWLENWVPV